MKILLIIPARMGSSRFPGKPLKKIQNKPMIEHVYRNVSKNKLVTKTIVATCDNEIKSFIESIGGTVVMTSKKHERASDRCAEAVTKFEKINNTNFDIVVMVQGDEPLVHPYMLDEAIDTIKKDNSIKVVNLLGSLTEEEYSDKNIIKVIVNKNYDAIYFSRKQIPFMKVIDLSLVGKQICIIPFERDFLLKYSELEPTPLEITESIDMLRVIEYGYNVRMKPINLVSHPVDIKEDIYYVERLLDKDDIYIKGY